MEKSGGSKLLQMQARFQQKQMAEREMKIASLYEAQQARALTRVRHSPVAVSAPTPPTAVSSPPHPQVQPGKVRQMFEERRTKAGIDKSYPLQPIQNNTGPRRVNGQIKSTVTACNTKLSREKKTVKSNINSHTIVRKQKLDNMFNGSGDLNHNHVPDLNAIRDMKNVGDVPDETDGYRLEDETFPEGLAPAPTPRESPPPPLAKRSPVKTNGVLTPKGKTPPRRTVTSDNSSSEPAKTRGGAMQRTSNPAPVTQKKLPLCTNSVTSVRSKPSGLATASRTSTRTGPSVATDAASGADGAACAVCGRRFAPDRLQKHEEICKKASSKKRKPFDALKHRLAGTEAEPFIAKTKRSTGNTSAPGNGRLSNSNWRQKHEEFIQAIRAAKQVQAHLNAGGKLSDLPPPPPSENPDYVTCPHCNRRFNQAAAERHIPKCATYQFNKPKPQSSKRR